MKYSFIIPTLNEEKVLQKLLEQLSNSQYKNLYSYEIIVSDGGSSDKTVEIANRYADKILIHNESRRQNISEGRNKGASAASGEVFVFVNGDVFFESELQFLKELNDNFLNSKFLAMTCNVSVHPSERKFSDVIFLNFYNWYFSLLNTIGIGMGRGECQVISRMAFFEHNGYNERMAAGEDFDLFKRIRKNGLILFNKKITVYESPRRYRKYGHLKIFVSWLLNALYVIFTNKSLSTEWEEVR